MKIKLCLFLLIIWLSPCLGTDDPEEPTAAYHSADPEETSRHIKSIHLDIGVNFFINNPSKLNLKLLGSTAVNVYYAHKFRLGESNLYFNAGVGLGLENYKFSKNLIFEENRDSLTVFSDPLADADSVDYIKSKLSLNYVDVPFEFQFKSSDNSDAFTFALGAKIGVLFDAHTKRKVKIDNNPVKYKTKGDFNLNHFRYGLTARMGLTSFNLFAYYGLNSFFRSGEGPKMNTMILGVNFSLN